MTEQIEPGFAAWVIIQQMGHVELAGYVQEELVAGEQMLRLDIPEVAVENCVTPIPAFTKYVHPKSLYGMTIVNEDYARHYAQELKTQPVQGFQHSKIVNAMAEEAFKKLTLPQVTQMAEALVEKGILVAPEALPNTMAQESFYEE